ncbi:site-2 protease family protein [archaeon]|jgi:membrane-associated protease RseP (regulator of RpoE activity)|nr:site-2 protease family protein [archaeon]MBT6823860.1 site-2 protease family protein [archaeon]MBT7107390.1 site-2 protease family protein [archaeon]MBT7297215.1 site-2 protease family protein [archaeon]
MNLDILLLIVFGISLLIFLITSKKAELEKIAFPFIYMYMYRTKLGLNLMDKLAKKHPRILNALGYVSISVGFIGMFTIIFYLLYGAYNFMFMNQPSPIQLLLPGLVKVPGIPTLSFFHWIIAIFLLAAVHEFSHGVFARLRKIKIKSSGFAIFGIILPIIPAAFVEPDEKKMASSSTKTQLEVMSAGPFANIVTAFFTFFLFALLIAPAANSTLDYVGVQVMGFGDDSPLNASGMQLGESIISVKETPVSGAEEFIKVMGTIGSHERINIQTENFTYSVVTSEHPEDSSRGYLGITVGPSKEIFKEDLVQKFGMFPLQAMIWIKILFFWIFMANLGVGLFNLLPITILDGGRMFYLLLFSITKDEKKSMKTWKIVSTVLFVIILLLLMPQFYELFVAPLIRLFT